MFINDIWSCGVTTKTKKIVAEAQKDGYLLNFLQLELDEGGLPNWKTINSFCELVRTSASNDFPHGALQSPREKLDRLMNAIFLKTFNLRNYEEDPLSAGEILLFTKMESIDRRGPICSKRTLPGGPYDPEIKRPERRLRCEKDLFFGCL